MSEVPPPLPAVLKEPNSPVTSNSWWVEMADKATGPFNIDEMRTMINRKQLDGSSLVVPLGQSEWVEIRKVAVLARELPKDNYSSNNNSGYHAAPVMNTAITLNTANIENKKQSPIITGDAANKSPALAALLSLLIVGLGQLYNGDFGKGILMFVVCVVLWIFLLGWIINIWSIIDAYGSAKQKRDNYQALAAGRY